MAAGITEGYLSPPEGTARQWPAATVPKLALCGYLLTFLHKPPNPSPSMYQMEPVISKLSPRV